MGNKVPKEAGITTKDKKGFLNTVNLWIKKP